MNSSEYQDGNGNGNFEKSILKSDKTAGNSLTRTVNNRGMAKGWFPKGWFWRMFPRNENRNEGTFAKTTLL